MGHELNKLMKMYGVSTPTMASYSGAPKPGQAPTAVAALVKPADLRAQPTAPVAPVKPKNNATQAERQAYQVALTAYNAQKGAYDADLKAWKAEKNTYDTAIKSYNSALPKYQQDVAKYDADKAAFDESVRKYGLDQAQYDQYKKDYQNRMSSTNMYNQAQFSTTGANVPAITTFSDAQKAALGYGPAVAPTVGAPGSDASNPKPVANPLQILPGETKAQYLERVKGMGTPDRGQNAPPGMMYGPNDRLMPTPPQPGPQDFTGIGQGGLNQQVQQYMATNPSMPDLNAYMTRYGLTNYDMRNAMGTGTTYGAPQWSDTLASPVYSSSASTAPTPGTGTTGTAGNLLDLVPGIGGNTGTTTNITTQGGGRDREGGARTMTAASAPSSGGYKNLRDMFDGGGPGRSGPRGGYTSLRDMFDGGGPGRSRKKAEGGYIQNYAQGGTVQGYQRGGPPSTIYGGAGDDMMMGGSEEDTLAEDPQDAMMAMLERYAPKPVDYSAQIAAATERRAAEQKAFEELLMGQLNAKDNAPQSKAEMYFRLAAAFGAPTKTGNFSENLALVGQTMAEELAARSERERENRAAKLGVQTELQKMRMEAAGEELDTYRGSALVH